MNDLFSLRCGVCLLYTHDGWVCGARECVEVIAAQGGTTKFCYSLGPHVPTPRCGKGDVPDILKIRSSWVYD